MEVTAEVDLITEQNQLAEVTDTEQIVAIQNKPNLAFSNVNLVNVGGVRLAVEVQTLNLQEVEVVALGLEVVDLENKF